MTVKKTIYQKVWAIALIMAGIGVFFRIPQVMPEIEKFEYFSSVLWFVRFCFYLLGVLLIGGGVKKIYNNYVETRSRDNSSS